MNEGKKGFKEIKHPVKPRNPVAKNARAAIGGGAAGAHKDKKKAAKQGDVKHKKPADAMAETIDYGKKIDLLFKMAVLKDRISEGLRDPKDNPCWKGYHPVGTKKKGGRTVPNCVPNSNESDVDESGLQYYTGKKKYGADGMKALAAAGRKGANQEELGRIKDKYVKKESRLAEYETHTYKDSQGNVWRVNDEGDKELVKAAPGSSGGGSRYGSRYTKQSTPIQSSGMYFYNVKPGQENDAMQAGLKQTKSGKWYSRYANPAADKAFGQGRFWQPKSEGVAEGLVGDVVVHNYTKMPIDLEPGQAQIAGWGPNDEPLYRVKGQDGKEVKTWSKRRMLTIAKEQGVAEGFGSNYAEQLAKQVFDHNPNIDNEDDVLNLGYNIAKSELGSRAKGIFRDEDFPSDFVSAYSWLKKQGTDEGFNPEYDDEAGMADNNLETLKRAVEGLDNLIGTGDNLPEWCQEKIAVAKSMLVTVWDYMESEKGA